MWGLLFLVAEGWTRIFHSRGRIVRRTGQSVRVRSKFIALREGSDTVVSHFHPEDNVMISSLGRGIVRLFHPAQHLWLRAVPLPPEDLVTRNPRTTYPPRNTSKVTSTAMSNPNPNNGISTKYSLEIGLTERGIEEVGDLTAIQKLQMPSASGGGCAVVQPGDDLLRIEFEGHTITGADELYHTVWETFEGATTIHSPLSGIVQDILPLLDDDISFLDEDSVLVRMTATLQALQEATQVQPLVKEIEYFRILKSLPRGKFAE